MILDCFGAGLEMYQSTSCVINFEKVPLLAILAVKMESDGDFLHPICTYDKLSKMEKNRFHLPAMSAKYEQSFNSPLKLNSDYQINIMKYTIEIVECIKNYIGKRFRVAKKKKK